MRALTQANARPTGSFVALTVIVTLAGCGGGTSSSPLPAAGGATGAQQSLAFQAPAAVFGAARPAIKSWLSPEAKQAKELLYVSTNTYSGTVNIYAQAGHNQAPVGQLSGFEFPNAVFVDASGDLFVADAEAFDVPVFKHGATTPYKTLNDPNEYPYGVAEDSKGNVYVANATAVNQMPGNINVYKKGSLDPTSTLDDPNYFGASGIATDSSNNVYACFNKGYGSGPWQIVEFRAGTSTPIELGLSLSSCSIGVQLDGHKQIIAADPFNDVVDVYVQHAQTPKYQLTTTGEPIAVSLNGAGTAIFVTNVTNNSVEEYSYPAGKLLDTISKGITSQPLGVAAYPALKT